MRIFPNMVVMAPGDRLDVGPMLDFALAHDAPVSLRYPRAATETIARDPQPIEVGQAEVIEWESDGMIVACGAILGTCVRAATILHERYGLNVGVINARFVKPLDKATIGKAIEEAGFVLTVEEGCLAGGFGSAVLEAANDAGLSTQHLRRLGLPDRFIMHAERDEQLAEVGLDVDGIVASGLELARAAGLEFSDLGPGATTVAAGSEAANGAPHANGSAIAAGSSTPK
jgi:1-deoxy-D-xylulose-5-phosphate synthase